MGDPLIIPIFESKGRGNIDHWKSLLLLVFCKFFVLYTYRQDLTSLYFKKRDCQTLKSKYITSEKYDLCNNGAF